MIKKNRKGVSGITVMIAIALTVIIIIVLFNPIGKAETGLNQNKNFVQKLISQFFSSDEDLGIILCSPEEAINVEILEPDVSNKQSFFLDAESFDVKDVYVHDHIKIKFSEPIDILIIGLLSEVYKPKGPSVTKIESNWEKVSLGTEYLDCTREPDNSNGLGYEIIDCKIKKPVPGLIIKFPSGKIGNGKRICKMHQKIGFKIK